MPKIYKRNIAKNDLVECYVYLAENANLDIADQFLENTEASFNELAINPFMGSPSKRSYRNILLTCFLISAFSVMMTMCINHG